MGTLVTDLQAAVSPQPVSAQQHTPQIGHETASSSDADAAAGVYDFKTWQYDLDDEEQIITVDDLIQQLAASHDATTLLDCLKQLTRTNYSIAGCDQWHHLLQMLPRLLGAYITDSEVNSQKHDVHIGISAPGPVDDHSAASQVALATEQLLLDKLAPEVLDCSPEPLAQLLTAFLSARSRSSASTEPQDSVSGPAEIAHCIATASPASYSNLPAGVVQLLVVGLHNVARQFHFLDPGTSMQLCNAVVEALLTPLQMLLRSGINNRQTEANQQRQLRQEQRTAPSHRLHVQTRQGQQRQSLDPSTAEETDDLPALHQSACCCLAEQLLLSDPPMGWLHRLNACSSSGRPFRQAMEKLDLVRQLLECVSKLDACSWLNFQGDVAAERASSSPQLMQVQQLSRVNVLQHPTALQQQHSKQHMHHCSIIAAQLLTTLIESRAGRLLVRRVQQSLLHGSEASEEVAGQHLQTLDADSTTDSVSQLIDVTRRIEELFASMHHTAEAVNDAALDSCLHETAGLALKAWAEQTAEERDKGPG